MNTIFCIGIFLIVSFTQTHGQTPPWFERSFQIGSSTSDTVVDITCTNSSVIAYGSIGSSCSVGGSVLNSGIFLASYNKTYGHQWSKSFSVPSSWSTAAVATDPMTNDIVIVGTFLGSINLGGNTLNSPTTTSLFMAKFNSSGSHLWSVNGTGNPKVQDVVIAASGNIYVAGYYSGTVGCVGYRTSFDMFVSRYTPAGVCSFAFTAGGATSWDQCNAIAVDSSEFVYMAGFYQGSDFNIDVNGAVVSFPCCGAGILMKVEMSTGEVKWYKTIGDTNQGSFQSVAVDATNVYAIGTITGTEVVESLTMYCNGTCMVIYGVVQQTGGTLFRKYVNGTFTLDSVSIGLNNFYMTGYIAAMTVANFAPGYVFTGPGMFLAAYDASGSHTWSILYPGSGTAVAGDQQNPRVYSAASFSSASIYGSNSYTPVGGQDVAMLAVSDIAPSPSPSVTPTTTPSPSRTSSPSRTPSVSPTPSTTPSSTPSPSPTSTLVPSASVTPTASITASVTPTPSLGNTPGPTHGSSLGPSSSPTPQAAGGKRQQQTHTTAIVGAVVGGVVGIGAIIAAIMIFKRRRQNRNDHSAEHIELQNQSRNNKTTQSDIYVAISPMTGQNSTSARSTTFQQTDWIINYDEIIIDKKIGSGAFGEVWKGTWRGVDVAVKKLLTEASQSDIQIQDFFAEAELMKHIKPHPNITQLLGVCDQPLCIVTEFIANGSLQSYLQSHNMDALTQVDILKGTAAGMLQLHSQGVIHRDLAARNILLDKTLRPKVSDFGMSRVTLDNKTNKTETDVGPIKWMAPEAMTQKVYNTKTDVWSFGIVIYEVLTRKAPYSGANIMQVGVQVAMGTLSLVPEIVEHQEQYPTVLVKMIEWCLRYDPKERPEFQDIIALFATVS